MSTFVSSVMNRAPLVPRKLAGKGDRHYGDVTRRHHLRRFNFKQTIGFFSNDSLYLYCTLECAAFRNMLFLWRAVDNLPPIPQAGS
jgi:hypothetical protein